MKLELIDSNDQRINIVKKMLETIDGVSPESLAGNKDREIPTTLYLGYMDEEAVCVVEGFSSAPDELSLINFGISEEIQRQGKGRKFLLLVERSAKKNGFKVVRLISNPDAFGFYLECGYYENGDGVYGLRKDV